MSRVGSEVLSEFSRAPKQERSRRSFDRALDAAVALMVERGSDAFTLAEIADRAGVSVGSMYGRVRNKTDLLRAAHAREMARVSVEQIAAFQIEAPEGETLSEAVRRAVSTTAAILRTNARVLAGFMFLANSDAVILENGRQTHHDLVENFHAALGRHTGAIQADDVRRAIDWSFVVTYSVLARWLGLGSDPGAAREGDWDETIANLSTMVTAFLEGPAAH